LKLVEDGRWFLIREQPISPIDVSRYPRLRWAESKLDLLLSESKYPEADGPGKWKTFSVQADDAWAITGESWHWRPVVPDEEYEYRIGAY
jgi:hypothetical protein